MRTGVSDGKSERAGQEDLRGPSLKASPLQIKLPVLSMFRLPYPVIFPVDTACPHQGISCIETVEEIKPLAEGQTSFRTVQKK